MKVFLMYENRDFLSAKMVANASSLTQDLGLDSIFKAMSLDDEFIYNVSKKAILSALGNDMGTILFRQAILKDAVKNTEHIRELYDIIMDMLRNWDEHWYGVFSRYPSSVLFSSVTSMRKLITALRRMKEFVAAYRHDFSSEGFSRLFSMILNELTDPYFEQMEGLLEELRFPYGMLVSASLGEGNRGQFYVLRRTSAEKLKWFQKIFGKKESGYSFAVNPRDESGVRILSELEGRAINHVANALAQSNDHIIGFFKTFRTELAFYIGCLNLNQQLLEKNRPLSFPVPVSFHERKLEFDGLYDLGLALTKEGEIIGNSLQANHKNLFVITGANQGGKSTFLRSIGIAQLLMQCGMFVPAVQFSASVCNALFTHYKREEDNSMKQGKLEEELARMDEIIKNITPATLILFNESFAATNELEGSEIARQIITALVEYGVNVFFVTHLFKFSNDLYHQNLENCLFLRASRDDDASRSFRIIPGEPLETSYGHDLYKMVFKSEFPE